MYEVLNSSSFYKQFRKELNPGEFKFIVKAFKQSDSTVAIYDSENNVDCYFQLPGYKSTKVPENRCFIYKLRKGFVNDNPHIPMEDGRYKIPVDSLELWRNPYVDEIEFKETKKEVEIEKKEENVPEGIFERVERLTGQAKEKADSLEEAIKKMQEMEDKILKTLSKLS